MTKTEAKMLEQLAARGLAHFTGVRAYETLKKVEACYPSLRFKFSFNDYTSRSDWSLGMSRRKGCFEVSVTAIEAA